MSIPISYCSIVKAIDNPEYQERFKKTFELNLKCGHFTIVGCSCDPPCREISEEELKKFFDGKDHEQ